MYELELRFQQSYPGAAGIVCLKLPGSSTPEAVPVTGHLRSHNTGEACSSAQLWAERPGEFIGALMP